MKQIKSDKIQKKLFPMIEEPKKDFKAIKEHFKDINNMKAFLKDCPEFNNNFELLNYVNQGSCGVVYEGKMKKITKLQH